MKFLPGSKKAYYGMHIPQAKSGLLRSDRQTYLSAGHSIYHFNTHIVSLITCFRRQAGECQPRPVSISHWHCSSLPVSSGGLGQPSRGHPVLQTIFSSLLLWLGAWQTLLQHGTHGPHHPVPPHLQLVQPRILV